MKYFAGQGHNLGQVSVLPITSFASLCEMIAEPVRLDLTRAEFDALPRADRDKAKRVTYLVSAEFNASPCQRLMEHAVRCNLIFLDIDDAGEARRLLTQRWPEALGDLGFAVWHTLRSTPELPRLRVMVNAGGIPPARYVEAARSVAALIGMSDAPSSVVFHAVQPMFVPTVFADATEPALVEIAGL